VGKAGFVVLAGGFFHSLVRGFLRG